MSQIKIKVGHPWDKRPDIDLVKRIALFFCGTDEFVSEKEDGGSRWHLNYQGNDYWMNKSGDGEFIISHRLNFSGKADILRQALIYVLSLDE